MSKPIKRQGAPGCASSETLSAPFVHKVRVRWGDCDPAAIAYTPNIPAWALEAIDAWWEHQTGIDWYHLNIDRGISTPFVHMSMDFRSPVTPRDTLECEVVLISFGNSSVRHRVSGYQRGVLCFDGEFVSVFADTKKMTPRTPPPDLLSALQRAAGDNS